MGEVYGLPADQVLPVRGLTHGLELVFRLAACDGQSVEAPDAEPYRGLAALYPVPSQGPRPPPSSSARSVRPRRSPRWPSASPPPCWSLTKA
jgi:hypothetical protein